MPALRTTLRDKLLLLVEGLEAIDSAVAHKLDKVEKDNTASVYLAGTESEPGAMRGQRSRVQRVTASLFLADATDVEAKGSDVINLLEKAVETARRAGDFGTIAAVHLEEIEVSHDATSKGKRADFHATFVFEFNESLT